MTLVKVPEHETLLKIVEHWAAHKPGHRVHTFLRDGERDEQTLTYAELRERARSIAVALRERCRPGERVVLIHPPGIEFICALFGCMYAGVVAVPLFPPDPTRAERTVPRFRSVLKDADVRAILINREFVGFEQLLAAAAPESASLPWIATDDIAIELAEACPTPTSRGSDLAFLQYTSGATGFPKGVMLTHANLTHNLRMQAHALASTPDDIYLSWLPLYHDMGLIGACFLPIFTGTRGVFMSPLPFLARPLRWLWAVHNYRATTTGGPNFAYELCMRRMNAENCAGLDLSSWRFAFCGAEPVRAETLQRFARAFASCGFRADALYPCYGLAEATLIVSGGALRTAHVEPQALARNVADEIGSDGAQARTLVSSGQVLPGAHVVIVDPETRRALPVGSIGEIWIQGGSVARGYWRRPNESQDVFEARLADTADGPFLRSGDLGFIDAHGELFVTGRLKDVIINNGQNLYPHDIEQTTEALAPVFRPGGCVAFAVDADGRDGLVVIQEVKREQLTHGQESALINQIVAAVTRSFDVRPYDVLLVEPGAVHKTSNGKVQRSRCREGYRSGEFTPVTVAARRGATSIQAPGNNA